MSAQAENQRRGITGCGFFVLDHIWQIDAWPQEEGLAAIRDVSVHNGGGPSNVLTDIARMGATFPLRVIGNVGDDEAGRQLRANCEKEHIDITGLRPIADTPSSVCHVMSSLQTGRRTFFLRCGADARLDVDDILSQPDSSRIFYLGYPLLLNRLDRVENGVSGHARVLRQVKASGQITAVDLVSSDGPLLEIMQSALPSIDYLFFNDVECQRLTGINVNGETQTQPEAMLHAFKKLNELGLKGWAILHMPEGSWAWHAEHGGCSQSRVNVPKEQIKGSNGAGDALAAGCLYALHEERDMQTALQWGACAAAACLHAPGASDGLRPLEECLELGRLYGFGPATRFHGV